MRRKKIYLPTELYNRVKEDAEKQGVPANAIMKMALANYFDEEEAKYKQRKEEDHG